MSFASNQHSTPKQAMDLMNAAEKVFDEAQYDLSIQFFTKALSQVKSPSNLAYALYMRGCAYKEIGNLKKARKDWEKATNLGFQHPWCIDLAEEALKRL